MRNLRTWFCLTFMLSALIVCAGCSGSGQQAVEGTVTLDGVDVKDGSIKFVPLEEQGTESGAPITNGKYIVPKENGLLPGKYRVIVTAGDGKTPANPDEPPGPTNIVSRDLIPVQWNTESNEEVTVTKGGPNKFDFAIKTK